MKPLTEKQSRVLEEIKRFDRRGQHPTQSELGAQLGGMPPGVVSHYLNVLQARGFLEPRKGKARAIRLTKLATAGRKRQGLPIKAFLVGGVCQWTEDESRWQDSNISGDIFKLAPDFFVQAVGKAICEDKGMRRNDLLAVKQSDDYRASEVLVANIAKQVWVGVGKKKKTARFIQSGRGIREIGPEDRVLGVVVGVIRLAVTRKQ